MYPWIIEIHLLRAKYSDMKCNQLKHLRCSCLYRLYLKFFTILLDFRQVVEPTLVDIPEKSVGLSRSLECRHTYFAIAHRVFLDVVVNLTRTPVDTVLYWINYSSKNQIMQ